MAEWTKGPMGHECRTSWLVGMIHDISVAYCRSYTRPFRRGVHVFVLHSLCVWGYKLVVDQHRVGVVFVNTWYILDGGVCGTEVGSVLRILVPLFTV